MLARHLTVPAARRSGARPSSLVSQLPRRSQYLPPLEPPDLCSSLRGSPRAGFPVAVSRACAVIGGLAVSSAILEVLVGDDDDDDEDNDAAAERWFAIRSSRSWELFGMSRER